MNRPGTLIWGHNVQQPNCTHTECVNLRQIRTQAAQRGVWWIVNRAERAIAANCPDQPGPRWVR